MFTIINLYLKVKYIMKKIETVLIIVLFAAVIALFVLQFTGNKKSDGAVVDTVEKVEASSSGTAFVEIDSVIINLDMFHDRREALLAKQQKAETELNNKGSQYEKSAKDYQEKISKGLVTRATAAEMEQALYKQQQDLLSLRDNLQSQLVEEETVMNRQIIDYITTYLEENKAKYNYQYIFGKSFGSVILYGDKALDITKEVTDALNEKYKNEKK